MTRHLNSRKLSQDWLSKYLCIQNNTMASKGIYQTFGHRSWWHMHRFLSCAISGWWFCGVSVLLCCLKWADFKETINLYIRYPFTAGQSLVNPWLNLAYIYIQLWGHLWVEDVWNHVRSHDSFNFYFGSSLIFGISSQIPKFCRFSLLKLKQRHGCNTSATPKPTVKTEENVREESENHFVDGRNPAPVINWLAVCRGFFPWTAL